MDCWNVVLIELGTAVVDVRVVTRGVSGTGRRGTGVDGGQDSVVGLRSVRPVAEMTFLISWTTGN